MLGTWNYEEKSSLTPWKHVSIRLGITIIYWCHVWKMGRHWKKDQKVKAPSQPSDFEGSILNSRAGHGSSPKRPPSWPVSTENIEGHPQSKHALFPAKKETKKYPGPSKWFKMLGYAPHTHHQSVVYSLYFVRRRSQSQIVAVMAQLTLVNGMN